MSEGQALTAAPPSAAEGPGDAACVQAMQWQALSGLLVWLLLLLLATSNGWSSALVPLAWVAWPALACERLQPPLCPPALPLRVSPFSSRCIGELSSA